MPISDYMRGLRAKIGHDLVLVPTVTVLCFDERERLLLVRHAEGIWTTPGGAVDPGESPADAGVREAFEETGLHVELVRLLGVYGGPEFEVTYRNGDRVAFLMTVFEARARGGEERPDGEETLELAWFTREELERVALPAWARIVLVDSLTDRTRAHFQPPRWRPTP